MIHVSCNRSVTGSQDRYVVAGSDYVEKHTVTSEEGEQYKHIGDTHAARRFETYTLRSNRLHSRYHQTRLHTASRVLTAFRAAGDLYGLLWD